MVHGRTVAVVGYMASIETPGETLNTISSHDNKVLGSAIKAALSCLH